jgi:sodium/potassium-transporting ATPase subunit alpha
VWAGYLNVQHNGFMTVGSMIANAISVLVAFVPEGLPLALSMGLTIIASRLCAVHYILVKQLSSVETLGSISMLFSDKTGTLTQNKMTVRNIIISSALLDAALFSTSAPEEVMKAVMVGAALCNQAKISAGDAETRGNSMHSDEAEKGGDIEMGSRTRVAVGSNGIDQALLNWTIVEGVVDDIKKSWRVKFMMPFNSTLKLAAAVVSNSQDTYVFVKGAPEYIFGRCSHYIDAEGKQQPTDEDFSKRVRDFIETVSAQGQRVIALARVALPADQFPANFEYDTEPTPNFPMTELTFLSCVAVSDPPREGVRQSILTLRGAGIKVAMVTGDATPTAVAIAKQIALLKEDSEPDRFSSDMKGEVRLQLSEAVVVEGKQLDTIDEDGWDYIFNHSEMVFARTTPDHKLKVHQPSLISLILGSSCI